MTSRQDQQRPPPFPHQPHGLIYADPAWEQEMYSDKGYKKAPQAHYDCMSLDEMKAMSADVIFATGPDCVCVMWAIFPMLKEAIELMECWGFRLVTGGSWNKITKHGKQAFGTGYNLRGSAEPFLIGKHGNPAIKNRSTRNSLFTGDVPGDLRDLDIMINAGLREHSRKPDEMIPLIENLFHGPYLELFARTRRPGWNVWGNQLDKFSE